MMTPIIRKDMRLFPSGAKPPAKKDLNPRLRTQSTGILFQQTPPHGPNSKTMSAENLNRPRASTTAAGKPTEKHESKSERMAAMRKEHMDLTHRLSTLERIGEGSEISDSTSSSTARHSSTQSGHTDSSNETIPTASRSFKSKTMGLLRKFTHKKGDHEKETE